MKWSDSTNRQLYSCSQACGSQLLSKLFTILVDQEIAKSQYDDNDNNNDDDDIPNCFWLV